MSGDFWECQCGRLNGDYVLCAACSRFRFESSHIAREREINRAKFVEGLRNIALGLTVDGTKIWRRP